MVNIVDVIKEQIEDTKKIIESTKQSIKNYPDDEMLKINLKQFKGLLSKLELELYDTERNEKKGFHAEDVVIDGFSLRKKYSSLAIKERDCYYIFIGKYCPNCFTLESCWIDDVNMMDNRLAKGTATFTCFRCRCFDNIKFLLDKLPDDWKIKQTKAMRRKEINDEMSELQDEMDDLERSMESYE